MQTHTHSLCTCWRAAKDGLSRWGKTVQPVGLLTQSNADPPQQPNDQSGSLSISSKGSVSLCGCCRTEQNRNLAAAGFIATGELTPKGTSAIDFQIELF